VRRVRDREISAHRVGAASAGPDLSHNFVCVSRGTSIMDEHLSTSLGEGERGRAAYAARGAGDESGLS
jgi:hypothetical protein